MPAARLGDDGTQGTLVVARSGTDAFWPVETRWRAVVNLRGELRPPEWVLPQVKPVPLSSRGERTLLDRVRADDGRAVLQIASEPGEHRVAATVIAALRLADDHPDRALRFLGWLSKAPTDPGDLRFLRRYLPGLCVLARVDDDLGVAVPMGRDALGLLAAELLTTLGDPGRAEAVLTDLTPNAPVALARAAARLRAGDHAGVHALAQDRPVVDGPSAVLRILNARARDLEGDPTAALAELQALTEGRTLSIPVERAARAARAHALRSTGRDVEADLIDDDFSGHRSSAGSDTAADAPTAPSPPLFGRSLTDAMDDAWARVRRQALVADVDPAFTRDEIDDVAEQVVALVGAGHLDAAEAQLLTFLDRADAWVDAGGPVVDDFFVLLAGLFDHQDLTTEEVATLQRLRDAHRRAGSEPPEEVTRRLAAATAILDDLG